MFLTARRICSFISPLIVETRHFSYNQVRHLAHKMAAESQPMKILVFLGSVRDGRMGDRVGKFVASKLSEAKHNVEVLDPMTLDIPLLKQALQFYPDPSKAPQILRDINEKIKNADAFVVITAEYNRQMPPALTNLIDHFPPGSYAFRPSAIVSYSLGPGAGIIAAAQCRTLMVELGCPPIAHILTVGEVNKKLDEAGKPQDEYLHKQAQKMINQLNWYGSALKAQREKVGIPS